MTFQPERILGKGTNAIVREFSAKDRTLAVKKPVLNQINFEDETHRDRYLAKSSMFDGGGLAAPSSALRIERK